MKTKTITTLLLLGLLAAITAWWSGRERAPTDRAEIPTEEADSIGPPAVVRATSRPAELLAPDGAAPANAAHGPHDRVPVMAGEASLAKSIRVEGRVRLSDGTILAGAHLVAMRPGADPVEAYSVRPRRRPPEPRSANALADARADDEGRFVLELPGPGPVEYFLREIEFGSDFGQDLSVHRSDAPDPIEHVLTGGRCVFRVIGLEGLPVEDVDLHVELREGDEEHDWVQGGDENGELVLHFAEDGVATVAAVRSEDGSRTVLHDVPLRTAAPNGTWELFLESLPPAALELSVRDAAGSPVLDWAVTVESMDGRFGPRHVTSEQVGAAGIVRDLPAGDLCVFLAPRYSAPPHAYDLSRSVEDCVEVAPNGTGRIELVAELRARMGFSVPEGAPDYRVRARHVVDGSGAPVEETWRDLTELWRFLEEGGAVNSVALGSTGLWFSDPLPAGDWEVEFHSPDDEAKPVRSVSLTLDPGRTTYVDL